VQAGYTGQCNQTIAIGSQAGYSNQGNSTLNYSVAIGTQAGSSNQQSNAVAIGTSAGERSQNSNSTAIGAYATQFTTTATSNQTTSIGYYAGYSNQGQFATAIGAYAGSSNQKTNTVAIGTSAGDISQNSGAVAIGAFAGNTCQGNFAIAIGAYAGISNQHSNSIIISASGDPLNSTTSNALYITPIAVSTNTSNVLIYNTTTKEVNYSTAVKTFIIDHPTKPHNYLVHACTEGPEAGVYYRGKSEITVADNNQKHIYLPDYVKSLAKEFTIQVTSIYNGKCTKLNTSSIENNSFTVYGEPCKFYWTVHGTRESVEIEPLKNEVIMRGNGPYRYVTNKV
jgi:hypothetical protein